MSLVITAPPIQVITTPSATITVPAPAVIARPAFLVVPTTDTLAAIRLTRTISAYTLAAAALHGFPQAIAPLIQVSERHQTKQAND